MKSSHPVEILNAVFTPMYNDGTLNLGKVPELFEQTELTGSQGVFLNGTTGECMSLTTQERMRLVESWVGVRRDKSRPDFKILVHAGSANLYETAEMAKHAQEAGADGVSMVSTFYFRPKTLEDLIDQCAYVASACREIPFYYYNIPSLTGVSFPLPEFTEMAIRRIPNFAGLKNSFNDTVDYQHCLNLFGDKCSMYWGTDEVFMMLYTAGNRHYVGSTYNYMSAYYREMLKLYMSGDENSLLKIQKEADEVYGILSAYNGIIAGKEIMRFLGTDCGPVRKPLKAISRSESDKLLSRLKETSLFERIEVRPSVTPLLQQR